jgi:23S rRNA pseudouridine2605 synthase
MSDMRLQRYLSRAGVAARRKAEELIVAGRVTVNGEVVTQLGTKVDPVNDRVTVDGQAVHPQDFFYLVLNKPKACLTAVSDPEGRPTIMDYLPGLPVKVAPVGRLDFYSEGVLLLTNDGELSAALQAPRTHVEKTYHVKLRGEVRPKHLEAMREGVTLDDGYVTRPAKIDRLKADSRHDWLVITLTEGKSRQIHRMAEGLGYQVLKLQRVAFGGITFHGLRVGDARELTQAEVNALREAAGLARSTTSRGAWTSRREDTELARRAKRRQRDEVEDAAVEPPARRPPAEAPRKGRPSTGGGRKRGAPGPTKTRTRPGAGGGRKRGRPEPGKRAGTGGGRKQGGPSTGGGRKRGGPSTGGGRKRGCPGGGGRKRGPGGGGRSR